MIAEVQARGLNGMYFLFIFYSYFGVLRGWANGVSSGDARRVSRRSERELVPDLIVFYLFAMAFCQRDFKSLSLLRMHLVESSMSLQTVLNMALHMVLHCLALVKKNRL